MELRIIGIINENDVVAFDEIAESRFGDNDNLSSMVANLIDADILILLTDIDGLYTADPRSNSDAELIKIVDQIDESIERLAGETSTREGTGGMITKIEAAKLATASGVDVIIANGRAEDILLKIGHGEQAGTFFKSQMNKLESRKRWMLAGLALKGQLFVDSGACTAIIKRHKSLLPAGIVKVQGTFQRGDIVEVLTQDSEHIASGISNYSSDEINSISGVASNRITALLGHEYGTEVIHRNNMVVIYSK
jgi:glutamate 5-kinase